MNVFKLGRKALTVGTVFSTILWSVGVSALVPAVVQADTCPSFKSGDLLKVAGHPAIYSVDSNGKVLYFPSGDEFKSWNANEKYSGYTTISQACYDALPVPSVSPLGVNFRAGSYVVKRPSSDQIYVVEPNNTLAKVTTDAAKALYGASYKVKTVADVFWPNYVNRGVDVTEGKAHAGMLVSNGGNTYLVNTDGTYSQVTASGFAANRFKTAFVRAVSSIGTVGAQITDVVSGLADRTQTGGGAATIGGGVVTTPTGGAVSIGLASDNPAATILASGTAFNPVLKVTLTAGSQDVAVTGLTLRKSGFAANTGVSGADVIDSSGVRHGNVASSLTSDNDLVLLFTSSPVVVKANSSQTLTIRINLGASGSTGTVQFSLLSGTSVVTNGGSVSGNFPISGNVFTLQSGANSIAGVTLNVQVVGTSTLSVDATNVQDITKFQVAETTSLEGVNLKSLTVYDNGTTADTDVQDVSLVAQDGTVLAVAQQLNKTVVFNLATPYLIDKGTTKTFTVRAKIVNGAARTLQYTIYNNYDVVLTGVNTGANILPTTSATFPVGTGINTVTVGTGTLSFNKDASSPSSAITPGANGVVLAKYFAKPTGEDMELRQVTLSVTPSVFNLLTGSMVIRVNGASVFSGSPATFTTGTVTTVNLSTFPTLTAGQNNFITVESNISSGIASGATVVVNLDLTQVHRLITNDIIDPAVTATNGNILSVQAAALKVTTLATPVATSLVAGSTNVALASFELNAGTVSSGEDVKVSKIVVTDVTSGAASLSDIANLVMYDSSGNALATSASTNVIGSGSTTAFTFVTPILVPKAGSVVLTLKGDVISSSNASTHTFKVNASGDVTAVGVTTGNTVSGSALTVTGNGQPMALTGSGTLLLSAVTGGSAAPSNDQNITVGSTNVPVFAFKLSAQNEPIKITSLKVTASGTLSTVNNLVNLKLSLNADGSSPFASASQMVSSTTSTNTSTTYTWTATDNLLPAAVQPGSPVTVYVKADIGAPGVAVLGDSFRFKFTSSSDITAKGASSGTTLALSAISGAPVAITGITYVSPFSVSLLANAPTGNQTQAIVAGTQIAQIKITNNGTSKVTMTGVKFTDSGSHSGSTTTYKLFFSDQNSSNFTGSTASSTNGSVDFSALSTQGTTFTIDGGAFRYVTVAINTIGSSVTGDTYQLSIASLGDVSFTAAEADLGYDSNNSGTIAGNSNTLFADGKPSLATLTKQ